MAQQGKASKMAPANQGKYPFPSCYGSYKSMVVSENEDGTVVCKDEFGQYTTLKSRLDNGLADPNRYATSRLGKLLGGNHKKDQQ